MRQLAQTLRRRTGVAIGEVDRRTAQLARQTLREVAGVQRAAHRALAVGQRTAGRGGLPASSTRLSIWAGGCWPRPTSGWPATAASPIGWCRWPTRRPPDPQGQAPRADPFGSTLLLAEDERGVVADHQLSRGNPPDAPQLLPAVHRVAALRGRRMDTVVADRGFGVAANDRALAELGVWRIGLQRTGTRAGPGGRWSRPARSSACATGGSGSKPALASSNARSGCDGPGCAAWTVPCGWAGLGIFASNLQRMTVVG